MNITNKNDYFFKQFDKKYSTEKDLGIVFVNNKIRLRVWQPLAIDVRLLIFEFQKNQLVLEIQMEKTDNCWEISIDEKYEGYSYQYKITHPDSKTTIGLDPYALSVEPFNWEGDEKKVAKGVLINIRSQKLILNNKIDNLSNFNNISDPLIYELQIRDFTSGLDQEKYKNRLGTFNAALENNIFSYLNELSISHLQLLPINSIFTIDEKDLNIVKKGSGTGWTTNYNWGYDPLNYFSLSNWYSSNPSDPYQGIIDFKNFVNTAHKHGIGIILDVVYNHMMTNDILNNIFPDYYYRNRAKTFPVNLPPLASQRIMVRRLIIESLIHWVETYNVDGFRFDLSTFIDSKTLTEVSEILRDIKPDIVLHGEAWRFSDLKYNRSWTKGITTNNYNFAYFNDTIRDSLRGNEFNLKKHGLILKYSKNNFLKFTNSTIGNINSFRFRKNIEYSQHPYDLFASNIGMTLNYVSCHDGYTLWDKINVNSDAPIDKKIQIYKQALLASVSCQGRYLLLAGTELLQSKPCDRTGQDSRKSKKALGEQLFNDQADDILYCENTYKTTDFVNSIKWKHLEKSKVKEVFEFCKKLFEFRQSTPFFRLSTNLEIKNGVKILNQSKGLIIYKISVKNDSVIVLHNFSHKPRKTFSHPGYKIFISNTDNPIKTKIPPGVSQILIKEKNENS